MRDVDTLSQDLVFIGGGHTHALVLRALAMQPIVGLRTTLISPASHTPYSGMLPGLVAGHYTFAETHIDLARLCQWAGVRFVAAEVTALDPAAQTVTVPGRPPIGYDLLSIDIGSQPELDPVPGARKYATPVKPVAGFWQRWQGLLAELERDPGPGEREIAVVGGGAGGVELAMAFAHTLRRRPVRIQLYWSGPTLLAEYHSRTRRTVERALRELGVSLHPDSRVERVDADHLHLQNGRRAGYDQLFWCTGASAARWVASSGLQTDERGFLAVHDTLQCVGDARVFGAGDIATQVNHPRPKAGVYAVRQAPTLAANLRNRLLGRPLRSHRPQRRFLSLVSLGGRRAAADRGPLTASGAWVWRWKDRIDREFMARFDDMPEVMAAKLDRLPDPSAEASQPPCGGCGAKVGADTLGRVLGRLSLRYPAHCRREDLGDDVSIIPAGVSGQGEPAPAAGIAQSVDVLRALVDDPWIMGRIAANHAMSDLFASGARPVSALASISLPFAGAALLERELEQLLAGSLHEFSAADCRLTGGHSLQGAEMTVGFTVNGVAIDETVGLLPKRGLRVGDKLVLTRALGTGTLFAAHMRLLADGRHIAHAIRGMLRSNGEAARTAVAHRASACTDITGFGLAGHLLEMLDEGQAARIDLAAIPLLPGAAASLAAGIHSSMHAANAEVEARMTLSAQLDRSRLDILFDPQTAGGLVIGVDARAAASLCSALRAAGYEQAAIIGEVLESGDPGQALLLVE